MDFFELYAYVALANYLHFSKAAASINLSPSALSRMLVRLENEVQVVLIERNSRHIQLTEEGKLFLDFARDVLHRKEDILLKLVTGKNRLRGFLRLYASVTACYSVLPPFAASLSRFHPELRLSVQTGDPSNAAEAVRDGRAELALDAKPDKDFSDLEFFPVKRSPLVFVYASSGLLSSTPGASIPPIQTIRTMSDLISWCPLILPKNGTARDRLNKWFRSHNPQGMIAAETEGNEAILALTRLGMGVGLVPEIVLENSPFAEGLKILDIQKELGFYEIGFIQKPQTAGSLSAQQFRKEIAKLIISTYATADDHQMKV
ncbi:MAG TPA: LysR substrate-binding domain-containing protein [Treponemataceae bacterium]|nr:LysR substrate-binding domain-containing protein [Treponemataceae bacterium]HQL32165.1 LysR substrate-binding domain-containing protein [Treponemataceae bacterium]